MTDLNRPLLGEPDAPCRTCGAPLAVDQRYCLECGARRAEARLPFLDVLARQVGTPVVTETTTVPRRRGPAWLPERGPGSALVAGVACLLLALGIGVLIGGWGDDGTPAAATPQVINLQGQGAPAAAPASTAAPISTTAPATTTEPAKSDKKRKASSSTSASKGSKATNSAVKALDSTSGTDYSKKSSKLPKTLGTGGKAPPKDDKPAAGGGDFQTIG